RGAAAEKAEHKDAAAPRKTAQALVEHISADRVIDDVDAAVVSQRLHLVSQPFAIVNRVVGPFFEADLALFVGAGGRDDGRTEQFGDLDRGDPDAAGGAVDHHPIAGLHAAALQ